MKQQYNSPILSVMAFTYVDVITASVVDDYATFDIQKWVTFEE